MRSGSTLLKALLGQAPDIAHLPEYNFQRYHATPLRWYHHAARQSHQPILLFKQPAPVRECTLYPSLPAPNTLPRTRFYYLILVRDPAATIASLLKMHSDQHRLTDLTADDWLAYWGATYTEVLNRIPASPTTRIVHYEHLLADPLAVTRALFQWVGSVQQEGVAGYAQPDGKGWHWGKDDAGEKIHSHYVQSASTVPPPDVAALCHTHPHLQQLITILRTHHCS
jgi:hypothetical protein